MSMGPEDWEPLPSHVRAILYRLKEAQRPNLPVHVRNPPRPSDEEHRQEGDDENKAALLVSDFEMAVGY